MKCVSCEVEINPQWKHAIDINLCPFCGCEIMEDNLKNLFSNLRQTMEELEKYHDQLNDWMLSNYNFIKTDSIDIIKYMPKEYMDEIVKQRNEEIFLEKKMQDKKLKDKKYTVTVETENGEEEVEVQKLVSEEDTNKFFKRAEAKKSIEKNQHIKEMAQKIKREGATVINQAGLANQLPPGMLESADPEAVAEFEAAMSGNEIVSSLPDSDYMDSEDRIPSVVLNMASKASKLKDPEADLIALRKQHAKAKGSTNGSFYRS